ncbi:MAG: hypothetical protein LZF86_20019 [Nitrospira sp.]|nr:MAG: hypothetical protein LZF86_20019 [Nitrospira sp.]
MRVFRIRSMPCVSRRSRRWLPKPRRLLQKSPRKRPPSPRRNLPRRLLRRRKRRPGKRDRKCRSIFYLRRRWPPVRYWQMEEASWSFLRKPVAPAVQRESLMKPLPMEPLPNRQVSLPVWSSLRSAVSSCPSSP